MARDTMTSLTFYGGAGEIGGTKILLEDKRDKVFLDFGEGFHLGAEQSHDHLDPANTFGLEGLFEFGLMPRIPRTFSPKALKFTDMKYETPDIKGIFISHSHSDHIGHLPYVDPSIPVFMGHGTHLIADTYHEVYSSFFEIGEHDTINEFHSGDRIRFQELVVEPVHVEHSVPGAYGFIVNTSRGPVVYTGDLRMHGPRSDMTREFLRKAAKARPRALLIEGTNMTADPEHNFTEEQVMAKVNSIVSKSRGTVFTFFPQTNVDRFMTFYQSAVKNRRILVVGFSLARFLQKFRSKITVLPDPLTDPHIKIYHRPHKSGDFTAEDYKWSWHKELYGNRITFREIQAKPRKYLVHVTFTYLTDLVHIQPKDADFIYSSSEHFYEGEENEEQREVWQTWMRHFGITFHKAHCSGHASREDLVEMIRTINPEILIPVHTEVPEEFRKYHDHVVLPQKEGTLRL